MGKEMIPERKPLAQMEAELEPLFALLASEEGGGADFGDSEGRTLALATLKEALTKVREKRDAYAIRIKRWTREAEDLRDMAAELVEQARVLERQKDRLRGVLNDIMQQMGTDKLVGVGFQLVRMKNNDGTDVVNAAEVPREFCTVVPETVTPNKTLILKALKEGKEVPGAKLKPGDFRVDVKVVSS